MSKKRKKGITESEKKIMKAMLSGPKTYYDLYKGKKVVGSNTTAIEALKHLSLPEIGLIELKKELSAEFRGRRKKYYGLTFKGLIFLLKEGIINNKEVSKIREHNNIEIPVSHMLGFPVIDIEKDFPEAFYKLFALADIEEIPEGLLPFLTYGSSLYTLFSHFGSNPDSIRNYMEERNIGDFVSLELLTSLASMLKPLQHLMEKRFMEKEQEKGLSHE